MVLYLHERGKVLDKSISSNQKFNFRSCILITREIIKFVVREFYDRIRNFVTSRNNKNTKIQHKFRK